MQIVHPCLFIQLPRGSAETGCPVVRGVSVHGIFPDIVVSFWIVEAAAALHEPGMFVGGVVDDQVHDDLQAEPVRCVQHAVEILHGSEFCHDITVVRDIVAIVIVGGTVDGREPDHIDPELCQIRKAGGDSVQITDSVPVAVGEAARIDLIDDGLFPPCPFLICCHEESSFLCHPPCAGGSVGIHGLLFKACGL